MTKAAIQMTPGDDMHLTLLMAPQSLNFVTGQDREHLLAFGRAAFEAGRTTAEQGKCLHQIAEPAACVNQIDEVMELMRDYGDSRRDYATIAAQEEFDAIRSRLMVLLSSAQSGEQVGNRVQANCYSTDGCDWWRDCPDDSEFVDGLKVGDTYEVQASVRAWGEVYRVTKAPDEKSDDYEVELVSSDAPTFTHPAPALEVSNLKPLGYAAEINGAHFRRFGELLPDDDCYDHGTLMELYALPVSEEEAEKRRTAIAASQPNGEA